MADDDQHIGNNTACNNCGTVWRVLTPKIEGISADAMRFCPLCMRDQREA